VRLVNDLFFASGSADIDEKLHGVIAKVARSLDPEPNEILVHGHTDNVPLRSKLRFKSNTDLSEKRASSVAEIMKANLGDPARLKITGFGPDRPVASNKAPEGRAQNRRVEILLPGSGAACVE
jgi:type VI secretion system protein ImpK